MNHEIETTCHCFGVFGEAVRVASNLSISTACPKAAKQWHLQNSSQATPPDGE